MSLTLAGVVSFRHELVIRADVEHVNQHLCHCRNTHTLSHTEVSFAKVTRSPKLLHTVITHTYTLTLLAYEGQRPGEDVHEVGQPVGVWGAVELTDVHHVVLILQHRRYKNTHTRSTLCCHGFYLVVMVSNVGNLCVCLPLLLYTSR